MNLFLIFLIFTQCYADSVADNWPENRLLSTLLLNYDPNVAPFGEMIKSMILSYVNPLKNH